MADLAKVMGLDVPAGGVPTKEFFVPLVYAGEDPWFIYGDFYTFAMTTINDHCHFDFKVPHDFTTLTHCKFVYITRCDATPGSWDWTVTTDFAADGETYNIHSDSDTGNNEAFALSANQMTTLDISAAFTGLAADDYVGVKVNMDAINGTGVKYVYPLGLVFKYS
ncbi:hypothetical protein ES703_21913 [subsurface metagenome]